MDTIETILKRRSIRKFQDTPVEPEKVEQILRAAMQSPTGHNAQECEFLVVTDKDLILRISQASPETVSAKNAPMLIIPLANLENDKRVENIWACDMGAVCQTILLAEEDLGLGGCWLSCWPYPEKVKYLTELLALPGGVVPFAVLTCGYKAAEKPMDDRYKPEKVHWEHY